ncbi:phosphoribosyltransferase family protein [Vreelandella rituensis]|uniref:Phosphoribosyltransferase n=1 Tax=Vreelandella rituensis TaxID=2282306 RepID=A0A368TR23_9GAMM|nr:phosphoribosyltransferase family protein [Halomonas rituensis]RCV86776.1 phosphoribosyltransferase [Halomonas rituensis]
MIFTDRIHAGAELAAALADYAGHDNTILLALPRGGVPVAAEISRELNLPMDLMLVRKLGVPGHEEFAMGAIAPGDHRVLHQEVIEALRLTPEQVEKVADREKAELERRDRVYRGEAPALDLTGMTVILVDDGLATGASMEAAIAAARHGAAGEIVVAVPVAALDTCRRLERQVDRVVCPHQLADFGGVGRWYVNFSQVADSEVIELLRQHRQEGQGTQEGQL